MNSIPVTYVTKYAAPVLVYTATSDGTNEDQDDMTHLTNSYLIVNRAARRHRQRWTTISKVGGGVGGGGGGGGGI